MLTPRPLSLIAACLTFALASPSFASDYSHNCRSGDGHYEMFDDVLTAKDDSKQTDIPYKTLKETLLSQTKGYCLAAGQKYRYEAKTYVRRVRFDVGGGPVDVDMLCELASDGLPAAATCEKQIETLNTTGRKADAKPSKSQDQANPSAGALWTHNGSVMRLETDGNRRLFVYETPRPGIVKAGAKRGDVVFDGKRDGEVYRGTAYIFSKTCGAQSYPVNGTVSADERSVTLEGLAPVLGSDCNLKDGKPDVLRFDYVAR